MHGSCATRARGRHQRPRRRAPIAPAGPGVTAGHRQAGPSPPGAASASPTPHTGQSHIGEIAPLTRRAQGARGAARRRPHRPRRAADGRHAGHARCRWCPALASRRCDRLAAVAAVTGRSKPAISARSGGAAAALRRRPDLRQRGKRRAMSRGRRGREARVAWRQQQRHQAAPTVIRVAECMHMRHFSHAARTSQMRPRRGRRGWRRRRWRRQRRPGRGPSRGCRRRAPRRA